MLSQTSTLPLPRTDSLPSAWTIPRGWSKIGSWAVRHRGHTWVSSFRPLTSNIPCRPRQRTHSLQVGRKRGDDCGPVCLDFCFCPHRSVVSGCIYIIFCYLSDSKEMIFDVGMDWRFGDLLMINLLQCQDTKLLSRCIVANSKGYVQHPEKEPSTEAKHELMCWTVAWTTHPSKIVQTTLQIKKHIAHSNTKQYNRVQCQPLGNQMTCASVAYLNT